MTEAAIFLGAIDAYDYNEAEALRFICGHLGAFAANDSEWE